VAPVETVSVEVPGDPGETGTLGGIRDAVGPVGETDAPRMTVPVKPFSLLRVIVDVVDELRPSVSEDGFDDMEKPGAGLTTKDPSILNGWTVQ